MSFFFSHLPDFMDAVAWGMFRDRAIIMDMACSAVVTHCRPAYSSPQRPFGGIHVVQPVPLVRQLEFGSGFKKVSCYFGGAPDGQRIIFVDNLLSSSNWLPEKFECLIHLIVADQYFHCIYSPIPLMIISIFLKYE
jgi:hypothetical protein